MAFSPFKFLAVLVMLYMSVCTSLSANDDHSSGAGHRETGKASYYSDKLQGRKTASGEPFDQLDYTGAHRTLPFGTRVKVTNLRNGKSVTVKINDRGPFVRGRVIDLSRSAFSVIANASDGVIDVRIEVVD